MIKPDRHIVKCVGADIILYIFADLVGSIDSLWLLYETRENKDVILSVREANTLADKIRNMKCVKTSVMRYAGQELAGGLIIFSLVDRTILELTGDNGPLTESTISEIVVRQLESTPLVECNKDWGVFLASLYSQLDYALKKYLRGGFMSTVNDVVASGTTLGRLQKHPGLIFGHAGKPYVKLDGRAIRRFETDEYSFVMLLNLSARRISNKPKKGLTHKENDLQDNYPNYSGLDNLRRILSNYNLPDLIKPNRDHKGILMRDGMVYLDLDPTKIIIEDSIRDFRSTHRKALMRLLENPQIVEPGSIEAKDVINRVHKEYNRLIRNESLVDDAIKRVGIKERSTANLLEMDRLGKYAEEMLGKNGA